MEADLLFEKEGRLQLAEIKSGQTVTTDHIRAAQKSTRFAKELALKPWLIYGGGEDDYERNGARVLGWSAFSKKDLR